MDSVTKGSDKSNSQPPLLDGPEHYYLEELRQAALEVHGAFDSIPPAERGKRLGHGLHGALVELGIRLGEHRECYAGTCSACGAKNVPLMDRDRKVGVCRPRCALVLA